LILRHGHRKKTHRHQTLLHPRLPIQRLRLYLSDSSVLRHRGEAGKLSPQQTCDQLPRIHPPLCRLPHRRFLPSLVFHRSNQASGHQHHASLPQQVFRPLQALHQKQDSSLPAQRQQSLLPQRSSSKTFLRKFSLSSLWCSFWLSFSPSAHRPRHAGQFPQLQPDPFLSFLHHSYCLHPAASVQLHFQVGTPIHLGGASPLLSWPKAKFARFLTSG